MSAVPFVDIVGQDADLQANIRERIASICDRGRFVLGPEVEEFEFRFAEYCETEYCVCVNSGTSALHLALVALGVGLGDEVITTPMTFAATTWAISYTGATPVFVDIDPTTRNLDVRQLESALSRRTRAVVPVHLYGLPVDVSAIQSVVGRRGIHVVEDAAQAHGARIGKRRVGGLGAAGCFSFYPGKNLGAYGEGGAVTTNDRDLADRVRMLRDHGQRQRYRHEVVGYNYRMDAFQGAVLLEKLPRLDGWNGRRRKVAERYAERLGESSHVRLPVVPDDCEPVFHLYVVEVDRRDELSAALARHGIQTGLHYPVPVHLQPAYEPLGLGLGSFPNAERLARRCLSLPMSPTLSEQDVDEVTLRLRERLAAI